jgi:hypothetical protein
MASCGEGNHSEMNAGEIGRRSRKADGVFYFVHQSVRIEERREPKWKEKSNAKTVRETHRMLKQ